MSTKTKIQWTATVNPDGTTTPGATWNPIRGCSRVSSGCKNCYAESVAARFSGPGMPYEGLAVNTTAGPRWTGDVRLIEKHLEDPLRWQKPRRVFVNSMSDLFHENLADGDIDKVFAVMALSPRHTFQVLTKRADRMRQYFEQTRNGCSREAFVAAAAENVIDGRVETWPSWPLPNVWLGVSVENQETADARIPLLLDTPAAVRWVSYEPALGPVNFTNRGWISCFHPTGEQQDDHTQCHPMLDWIVVGGESGPQARPFDVAWARTTLYQCRTAGRPVAVFVKQLGSRAVGPDTHSAILRDRKGGDWTEWPADLRVREYPT